MAALLRSSAHNRSKSTPSLVSAGESPDTPQPADEEQPDQHSSSSIRSSISGAVMTTEGGPDDMVVWYEISVVVGQGQELGGARRRYREFHRLFLLLQQRYPHLLCEDTWGEHAALPPFPQKTILRAGWEAEVVVDRVNRLGVWLTAVTELLQYVSPELINFLNVPMYCAVRMLSGDLLPADLVEPCSPDTVMVGESTSAMTTSKQLLPSSPLHDERSLHTLAQGLRHSLERPGYNESVLYFARAVCAHAMEAAAPCPTVDESHRLIRSICSRALFKPCTLLAAVVYLDRIRPSMRRALLHGEGWALVALVVLVVAAKVYDSDYPISNADVCAPGLLAHTSPHASSISMRRVNACERRVLDMLDYNTIVSPTEFARYYLTMPFAFPNVPNPHRAALHADTSAGIHKKPLVPPSGASAESLQVVGMRPHEELRDTRPHPAPSGPRGGRRLSADEAEVDARARVQQTQCESTDSELPSLPFLAQSVRQGSLP